MTFWVAGAAVVSAGIGAYSSNKAAKGMQGAADSATALQQGIYNDTVDRNQPYVQGGTTAFNALLGRLGLAGADGSAASGYGSLGHVPTAEEVMAQPGYEFGRSQGEAGVNRLLNARGMSYSGAQGKALSQFNNNYATGQYQTAYDNLLRGNQQTYNQLSGLATFGQNSANNTATAGAQFGTQAGENNMFGAAAQGSNALAQGNIWGSAINQGASAYKNRPVQSPNVTNWNSGTGGVGSSGPWGGSVSDPWYG
jgi:hypothetical protein